MANKTAIQPGAIYLGDNGRLMCCDCAGATALYSGHDLSGQKVERLDCACVAEMTQVTCDCGRVRLTALAGPDGWPMARRPEDPNILRYEREMCRAGRV